MLNIIVKYKNIDIINILYPADSFTVGFQNETIYTISGNKTVSLDIDNKYCSKNIYIANQILDNKENIFEDKIYIYSKTVDINGCIEFKGNTMFNISATPEWNGTIQYSRDLQKWINWSGNSISSKKYGENYYIYFRGINNTKISQNNSWILSTAAECNGSLSTLLNYNSTATCVDYAFANWMKNQPITTIPNLSNISLSKHCFESMFEECINISHSSELPSPIVPDYAYCAMFKNSGLTQIPVLPANFIGTNAYQEMFMGTNIKISNVSNDEYKYPISFPYLGVPKCGSNWNLDMIKNTAGTSTSDPAASTTYYTNIEPTKTYSLAYFNGNGGTGIQPNQTTYNTFIKLTRSYYHKDECVLDGWGYGTDPEKIFHENELIRVVGDQCITAQWKLAWYPVENMVCEFLFKNNVEDTSDNDATISNYLFLNGYGRDGLGALRLSVFGNIILQNYKSNSWTISCWLNPSSSLAPTSENVIYFGEHDSLFISNTIQPLIQLKGQGEYRGRVGDNIIDYQLVNNNWSHIIFTYDSVEQKMYIYLNGILYQQFNYISDTTYKPLCLKDASTVPNDVYLDDLRIYTKAITAQEAMELYNYG